MTTPLAASARSVTVPGSGRPAYLVELAKESGALVLINLDQKASIVWVSSDSSVQPGSGVPVPGGGSITWTTPGPLYAVVAAGAPDTTLVLTAAVDGWQLPPPAEPDTDLWTYNGTVTFPSTARTQTVNLVDQLPGAMAWGSVLATATLTVGAISGQPGATISALVFLTQPDVQATTGIAAVSAIGQNSTGANTLSSAIAKATYSMTAQLSLGNTSGAATGTAPVTLAVALAPR